MAAAAAMAAGAMQEDLAEATPNFQAAMPGPLRPVPLASVQCLVLGTVQVSNRHRGKVFFFGGGDGGYYYGCYPVWNGYAWVNSCGYNY